LERQLRRTVPERGGRLPSGTTYPLLPCVRRPPPVAVRPNKSSTGRPSDHSD
jgi:hypothetical protein